MPLGMEVGIGSGDFMFDGDPATPEQGHTQYHPVFGHVHCGQTDGWMKTPLGTEVDLGPGHIVLVTNSAQLCAKLALQPPSFRPVSIVATVAHLSYG